MPTFYDQIVDIHTFNGPTAPDFFSIQGDASKIILGSDECPSLGPSVAKFVADTSSAVAYFVDNRYLAHDKTSFSMGFRYHSVASAPISDWGSEWTASLDILNIFFDNPLWDTRIRVNDGVCRARQEQSYPFRVTEFPDVGDPIQNGVPVDDSSDYFVTILYQRNNTCRARITKAKTGVIVGERSWTSLDINPEFLSIGLIGINTLLPVPQNFYMSDFVFDYTSAQYPLRDYYLYEAGDKIIVPSSGVNLYAAWEPV